MKHVPPINLCAVALLLAASAAPAATVEFTTNIEFSGAYPPAGQPPWLTATFDDAGSPGSVQLTLEATNLVNEEFIRYWYFNLDPAMDPGALVFAKVSTIGTVDDPTIQTAADGYKANGDGDYDIAFEFTKAQSAGRFGPGEAVTYSLTGIAELTAGSFDFPSAGKSGGLPTAAHVQGIEPDGNNSGWVSVPEPTTLGVLAVGTAVLLRRRRRA